MEAAPGADGIDVSPVHQTDARPSNAFDRPMAAGSRQTTPANSRPPSSRVQPVASAATAAPSKVPPALPPRGNSERTSMRMDASMAEPMASPLVSPSSRPSYTPASAPSSSRPSSTRIPAPLPASSRPPSVKLAGPVADEAASSAEARTSNLKPHRQLSVSTDAAAPGLGPPSSPMNSQYAARPRVASLRTEGGEGRMERASSAQWTTTGEHDTEQTAAATHKLHPLALHREDTNNKKNNSPNGSLRSVGSDIAISPLHSPHGSESKRPGDGDFALPAASAPASRRASALSHANGRASKDDGDYNNNVAAIRLGDPSDGPALEGPAHGGPRPISDPFPEAKPKILNMMGREAGPTKAMAILGSPSMDRSSMRNADDALRAEITKQRERLLQTVLLQKPSDDINAAPAHRSLKAAMMLGEVRIANMSAKAAAVLGGNAAEDGSARRLADAADMAERERQARESTRQTLLRKEPTEEQMEVQSVVPDKVLRMLGDHRLEQAAREYHGPKPVSPKALHILGDARLAGKKAFKTMGSAEQDAAARKRANEEWKKTLNGLGADTVGGSVAARGSLR